jgi:hypothetical protein
MVLILLCPWPCVENRLPLYRVVVKGFIACQPAR